VFETAYPYSSGVELIEAYVERIAHPAGKLFGWRVGRYRTPFGVYNGSDHAYGGFLRAPLIRYQGYYALSNTFLEHGADIIAGKPNLFLFLEASVGRSGDAGRDKRRSGMSLVIRGQATRGPVIVGVSWIDTEPSMEGQFVTGRTKFVGVDARWMREGVQLRGEWVGGRPFDDTLTFGGYVDLIVHRPEMGPITALARVERLSYRTRSQIYDLVANRQMIGARVRLFERLTATVEAVHNSSQLLQRRSLPIDLALSYSFRRTN
jgi:hypothetical protein